MRYPCPCCGYLSFTGSPGSEARCPICGWLDDLNQLHFPAFAGRPNGVSLLEAQRNFIEIGAIDAEHVTAVRFALSTDKRDPNWRALEADDDNLQSVPNDFDGIGPPEDPTQLYYWLPKN